MDFKSRIFNIKNNSDFDKLAIEIFKYQFENNEIYNLWVSSLGIEINSVKKVEQIPFLPISFFKTHSVITGESSVEKVFLSSGTGGIQSKHFVTDLKLYEESFVSSFEYFYGKPSDYCFLALLPSYLEREGSSLIYMVDFLIRNGKNGSAFYLNNMEELANKILELQKKNTKIFLIGVSFALLDFVKNHKINAQNITIMETGGMKGRRKEITRKELHSILKKGFNVRNIHSEYGMTELLSQAYSKGEGVFKTPKWMRILIRNTENPFEILGAKKVGGVNVVDLANYNSCSFVETSDLGKVLSKDGDFEIVGRFDNSDIRGCNTLITD